MPDYYKINFNAIDELDSSLPDQLPSLHGIVRGGKAQTQPTGEDLKGRLQNGSSEHASRFFLQNYLLSTNDPRLESITSPDQPDLVPNFKLNTIGDVKLTNSTTVDFQQTEKSIPIFGTKVVIEIDHFEKSLVSIQAELTDAPTLDPFPNISSRQALTSISQYCGVDLPNTFSTAPEIVFFPDQENDQWRLAYYFRSVPIFPPQNEEESQDDVQERRVACIGSSPRHSSPLHDYFVDAHSGDVFYYFSSSPRLDVPINCTGSDEILANRNFYGTNSGTSYSLKDPLRNILTYDYSYQDIDNPSSVLPASPVSHSAADFGSSFTAAISAHYHASIVFDFFNEVLKRNGIDDKGMVLESVVNVYSSSDNPNPSPEWGNAVWFNKKMWYGQQTSATGANISFARHLDIIGHELTHGITETTSNLVYRDLSGALNESFSDLFGIMIKNWYPGEPNSISSWNWEMAPGLGSTGGAIRNFKDPAVCGQPDHFSQYKKLPITHDNGGVHIYSGIHNRAAYNVITATDNEGNYIFDPREVAILYYLTLTRLHRFANFSDCLLVLLNVAGSYYAANLAERTKKQNAIQDSYRLVGIY